MKITFQFQFHIQNYESLKKELISRGHSFDSDTDSEVLIHLIEDILENNDVTLVRAIRMAMQQVIGAYAIVIMDRSEPDQLIAARKGSPLVIGVGKDEFFLASDATPIIEYTNEVVYLDDYEIAVIKGGKLEVKSKKDIAQLFHEKLDYPLTDDATELTLLARRLLRSKYVEAELGITGANFILPNIGGIADTHVTTAR